MESFPLTQQLTDSWETRDKKWRSCIKILAPIPFSLYALEKVLFTGDYVLWNKKKKGTPSWDPFGPWISHSSELLQDDGWQKACCVHKHMEVVWHFCKYYFVQSYCLKKKKALGISVQFFQLGECFVFKVRSMFKFSNFRHSS